MNYNKISKLTLTIIGIISVIGIYFALQTKFDYDFEQYFPHKDPDTEFFYQYRERFGSDNDFVLIGIKNSEGIFQRDFLLTIDSLTKELQNISHVKYVLSPTNLKEFIQDPLFKTIITIPYVRPQGEHRLAKDSLRVYSNLPITSNYFSKDGKSVSIFIKHDDCMDEDISFTVASRIRRIVQKYRLEETHFAGKIISTQFYIEKIRGETIVFIGTSLFLIVLVLFLTFRTFWGITLPISLVLITVVYVLTALRINNHSMDLLLNLLPPLMMVIGLSYVIHILTKYIDEIKCGHDKPTALKLTYKNVGLATLLAAVTTAIGFITLTTSSVKPVIDLGLYAVLGVSICVVLCFSFLPASLYLIKPSSLNLRNNHNNLWQRCLRILFLFILKHPLIIIFSLIPLLSLSYWGMQKLKINSYIQEGLRDNQPLKKDYLFYETNFNGIRPFEMSVQILNPDININDEQILQELNKLDYYLETEYGVKILYSPPLLFKQYNRMVHGGDPNYMVLPKSKQLTKANVLIKRSGSHSPLFEYLRSEEREARVSGIMPDIGSYEIRKRDKKLRAFYLKNIDTSLIRYKMTGSAVLMEKNNQLIAANLAKGLSIAMIIIAAIVGFVFRSFRMIGITLLCNVFPLLMIAAVMGFLDIDLKLSTAMIFTVAFGIAVDDTIHFISRFRAELKKGKKPIYALKRTYLSTGKAIVITSIILSGGFLSLTFSDFIGSYYIGLLTSLTLLFALLADIILLPALLLLFFNSKEVSKFTGLTVSQRN